VKAADEDFVCDCCMIGPILAPKPAQHPPAGAYCVWFCTFTARNGLDISASQWNTSPIYGKVRSAAGIEIAISRLRKKDCKRIRPGVDDATLRKAKQSSPQYYTCPVYVPPGHVWSFQCL
jgi:hypothetical protein